MLLPGLPNSSPGRSIAIVKPERNSTVANSNPPAERPDFLDGTVSTRDAAVLMFSEFEQYLSSRAMDASEVAMEMNMVNLMAIMNAETEEEMWKADESDILGGRDLPDVEQTILSYRVFAAGSRFNAPLKHFIIVDAIKLESGEQFVWNTGAPMLIAKLRWLEAHELLPYDCVIRGIESENGTRLRLVPVARRPVKATAS